MNTNYKLKATDHVYTSTQVNKMFDLTCTVGAMTYPSNPTPKAMRNFYYRLMQRTEKVLAILSEPRNK